MILDFIFHPSLPTRLSRLKGQYEKDYHIGDEIECILGNRHNGVYYSCLITTGISFLGDVNGSYCIYSSKTFDSENNALTHLTHQVASASLRHPGTSFFRYTDVKAIFNDGSWVDVTR